MSVPVVTLYFSDEEDAPTLQACLEQLLRNLSLNPEEAQDEANLPLR